MKYLRAVICLLAGALAFMVQAETLTAGPFIVDFHPDDQRAAEEGLRYLLEARDEFESRLPLGDAPVTMRIAHDLNEFLGLTGSYGHVGVNGVARASQSSIAVKSPRFRSIEDDYRGTVRHELLHILLHRNTDTDRLPRWLNEGICMMLSNEARWQSTIEVTRMHLTGQIISMPVLEQTFRAPVSDRQFGNAYAQALSMTRHLHNELGEEAFWAVVGAMNALPFEEAMQSAAGLSVSDFWADYSRGLWGVSLVTTLRTGSFWGVIAFLCLVAFFVRWRRNRRIVRRWEEEHDGEEVVEVFDWDRILEDAEAWKRGPDGSA